MNKLFYPEIIPDLTIQSPSERTITRALSKDAFSDLYELVHEQGLSYFPRINAEGDVELYLVFESIDAFTQSTHAEVYVEFKTYQDKLLAIIWTLNDPQNPLGFPIPFHIPTDQDRYMALRLLEQKQTWIHYLAYPTNQIIHIYSEAIQLPETEKSRIEAQVRKLYDGSGTTDEQDSDEEIKEHEAETIPASTLSQRTLLEEGKGFVFDYKRMLATHGEEGAQVTVMQAVHQALTVMHRHYTSQVRESTFTVWVAENASLLYLFVTPSLDELFDDLQGNEEEENPFSRFLLTIPEFVESVDGQPLRAGAYPIMRYDQGQWYHLELDEAFQQTLKRLFDEQIGNQLNPYQ